MVASLWRQLSSPGTNRIDRTAVKSNQYTTDINHLGGNKKSVEEKREIAGGGKKNRRLLRNL
jgi:hypothetical protein